MSAGEKKLLDIVRCLLLKPSFLLMDEPTAGLDPSARRFTLDLIRELASSRTVLVATHILSDIDQICDHVGVMHEGRMIFSGPMRDMKRRLRRDEFTLEDFLKQLKQVRKMGPLTSVLGMMPGMGKIKSQMANANVDESVLNRQHAIIGSMTPHERRQHNIINGSRRKRIAAGSGTRVQDVNRLLKNYAQVMKMMKKFNKGGMRGLGRGMLPF